MIPLNIKHPQPEKGPKEAKGELYECQPRAWEGDPEVSQGHFKKSIGD